MFGCLSRSGAPYGPWSRKFHPVLQLRTMGLFRLFPKLPMMNSSYPLSIRVRHNERVKDTISDLFAFSNLPRSNY
jgi:hypothetical protein